MVKNTFPVVRKCVVGVEAPAPAHHMFFLCVRLKKVAPLLCFAFIGIAAVGCHNGIDYGPQPSAPITGECISALVSMAESIANGW